MTDGYKSPGEELFEKWADVLGLGPAKFAKQMYDRMTSGGGSSGHFEFSVSEMKSILGEFEERRDAFDKLKQRAERAANTVRPPANDYASLGHTKASKEHFGSTFYNAAEQQWTYADALCQGIKSAIEGIEGTDAAAEEDMRNQQGSLG